MKKILMMIAAALLFPAMLFAKAEIVGYLPSYRSIPTQAQLQKITHLILMAIVPGPGTAVNLPTDGNWPRNLNRVIADAHANDVKVIIALGGWGGTGSFPESVKPANRTAFVNNIMAIVNQHGFDGVDIDWEYPETAEEVTNFEGFMVELKDSLGEKRLSFAIGAQFSPSKYTVKTYEAMDALQLMTYDMAGSWAWGRHHSDATKSMEKLDEWLNSGLIEKNKVFLGVPFYGRPANGGEAEVYSVIINQNVAQYSQVDESNGWCYDGVPTIKNKTEYAYDRGAGGIMIWELGQDYDVQNAASPYSLLKAIYDATIAKHGSLGDGQNSGIFTISVRYSGKGTVTAGSEVIASGGSIDVESGDNISFLFAPEEGFEISDIKIGGETNTAAIESGRYDFVDVKKGAVIEVVFAKRHIAPVTFNSSEYSSKSSEITLNDDENGKYAGGLQNGSYLEYLINISEAGNYNISIRNAVGANGQYGETKIMLSEDGSSLGTIDASIGEDWYNFTEVSLTVAFTEGNKTLRLTADAAVNIENISITKDGGTSIFNGGSAKSVRVFGAAVSNGKLNLSLPTAAKNAKVSLFDVRGRMLMNLQISIGSGVANIALPKNITQNQTAILQVKTDSGFNLTKKILIK